MILDSDYSLIKDIIDQIVAGNRSIYIALIVLVSINIGMEILKFITKVFMSNKERKNKRQLLIEERRIKILEKLFQMMDRLSLYDRNETDEMLTTITEIQRFITCNKIYISKKYQKCSNNILDYFKNVLTDFRQKSIEKETKLFEKFCDEFSK